MESRCGDSVAMWRQREYRDSAAVWRQCWCVEIVEMWRQYIHVETVYSQPCGKKVHH